MIKKCLFPVAGYGTRFLPATKAMPKEILPILDKPLVQYGVEEAHEAGMTDISFVTGRGKRAIEDHFDVNYELEDQIAGTGKESALRGIRTLLEECTFSYTRQIAMRGLGDAILTGQTIIGDEPFAVVLADDLCIGVEQGVLSQMRSLYKQFRCSIVAVEEVPADQTSRTSRSQRPPWASKKGDSYPPRRAAMRSLAALRRSFSKSRGGPLPLAGGTERALLLELATSVDGPPSTPAVRGRPCDTTA